MDCAVSLALAAGIGAPMCIQLSQEHTMCWIYEPTEAAVLSMAAFFSRLPVSY